MKVDRNLLTDFFLESSPYLQQHAHNPVNWFPWGREAFALAKKLKRPVFLSVGYSTCHWCHVMEEESFEDEEIAKILNTKYIAIKVDREQRPDVDGIYMKAVQALTGGGGWPMSVWMTHEKKPFYGGTYFPPRDGDRGARIGFLTLLKNVAKVYTDDPKKISETSFALTNAVKRMTTVAPKKSVLKENTYKSIIEYYEKNFDSINGGLTRAPKFPSTMPLSLLMKLSNIFKNKEAKINKMVTLTLDKMAMGGIYDQVGGGFHRYSVDKVWLAPHFEKMLYDNALLSEVYLEAYVKYKDPFYKRITIDILNYILKEMVATRGGFYSATDADSKNHLGHSEEGYFFTWSQNEFNTAVHEHKKFLGEYFKITSTPNFDGRTILTSTVKNPLPSALKKINQAKKLLYLERGKRPPPILDNKVLLAWNSLMISSMARAGFHLKIGTYTNKAQSTAMYLWNKLFKKNKLKRIVLDGEIQTSAFLDDYVFFVRALLDIFQTDGSKHWLDKAIILTEVVEDHFSDKVNGGYFYTADYQESLIVREKKSYDGAIPTANSLHLKNLATLYGLTSKVKYLDRSQDLVLSYGEILNRSPISLTSMIDSQLMLMGAIKQVVVVATDILDNKFSAYLKDNEVGTHVRVLKRSSQKEEIELTKGKTRLDGKDTAYVCIGSVCKEPTTDLSAFIKQL